jgi:aspartate/methionine/tyrosine aminotransferase
VSTSQPILKKPTDRSNDEPVFATAGIGVIPVSDHYGFLSQIPPSRMFLVKGSLKAFKEKYPDRLTYDASQGDGGASLPGVPNSILQRAQELQEAQGTGYDQPFGTRPFQKAVFETYWKLDTKWGYGPENVLASVGGRDALLKAYQAMLGLGYGRQGDLILVSRVPWISYNWGPFGLGGNTLLAPGDSSNGWAYTADGIRASVDFARREGREVAGMVITSPDNPTGLTQSLAEQAALARAALEAGVAFVLMDWMYHYITEDKPNDLNAFYSYFEPAERKKLIILDGLTKSLGASNIRNAHLIASTEVVKFIVALASHGVIPSFYAQAVAMAAYEVGYAKASKTIVKPTNASRKVVVDFLEAHKIKHIIGKGYYAFIHVGDGLHKRGWSDTEPFGQYLAHEHGLAVVPGSFFSAYGGEWIRFSYATPPENTAAALQRLVGALEALR